MSFTYPASAYPSAVTVNHVCPRCHALFDAPICLTNTYCHECFDEAFHVTPRATPWRPSLRTGIICLAGALSFSIWLVLR